MTWTTKSNNFKWRTKKLLSSLLQQSCQHLAFGISCLSSSFPPQKLDYPHETSHRRSISSFPAYSCPSSHKRERHIKTESRDSLSIVDCELPIIINRRLRSPSSNQQARRSPPACTPKTTSVTMPGILSNTLSRTRAARRSPFHRSISPPAQHHATTTSTTERTACHQHQGNTRTTHCHINEERMVPIGNDHCKNNYNAPESICTSTSNSTTSTSYYSTVTSSPQPSSSFLRRGSSSSLLWGKEIPVPSGTAWGHFVDFN
jgi:hypothetical protein